MEKPVAEWSAFLTRRIVAEFGQPRAVADFPQVEHMAAMLARLDRQSPTTYPSPQHVEGDDGAADFGR